MSYIVGKKKKEKRKMEKIDNLSMLRLKILMHLYIYFRVVCGKKANSFTPDLIPQRDLGIQQ